MSFCSGSRSMTACGRGRIELRGVGALEAHDGAGELDHRALQTEADPQERHVAFPRVPHGGHLALDATDPEAAGDQDAIDPVERFVGGLAAEVVGGHPPDLDVGAVMEPPVIQRLHHAEVGIAHVDVLADHRDRHRFAHLVDAIDQARPLGQFGFAFDPEVAGELGVESLVMQHQRHLVDRGRVGRADHAADRHVAQQGDLLLEVAADRAVGTTHDGVGLDTERAQLLHRVLRGLGLQLAGGPDEGHQGHVHERAVVAADLVPQLADRLEEGQRFDVTDGAADLDEHQVGGFGLGEREHALLDLVGDVRDHLHGLAEVVAPALLRDHRGVDGAGGVVGPAMQVGVDEPLVVTEVEVGLGAVIQHEDLAVLEGVHRPGVDVDVRVQLLDGDLETAGFEEASEGGGGDALPESGGDTPRDEDELRSLPHHGKRLYQRVRTRRAGSLRSLAGSRPFSCRTGLRPASDGGLDPHRLVEQFLRVGHGARAFGHAGEHA